MTGLYAIKKRTDWALGLGGLPNAWQTCEKWALVFSILASWRKWAYARARQAAPQNFERKFLASHGGIFMFQSSLSIRVTPIISFWESEIWNTTTPSIGGAKRDSERSLSLFSLSLRERVRSQKHEDMRRYKYLYVRITCYYIATFVKLYVMY